LFLTSWSVIAANSFRHVCEIALAPSQAPSFAAEMQTSPAQPSSTRARPVDALARPDAGGASERETRAAGSAGSPRSAAWAPDLRIFALACGRDDAGGGIGFVLPRRQYRGIPDGFVLPRHGCRSLGLGFVLPPSGWLVRFERTHRRAAARQRPALV